MRLVDNLAQYIEDNTSLTEATDLFIGIMPASPDNCVMIDQTGGVEAEREVPIEQPTIQVTVRNTAYPDGLDLIKTIYDLIHQAKDNITLETGGVDTMTIFAMGEPAHIGQDESQRHLFSVNFVFKIRA